MYKYIPMHVHTIKSIGDSILTIEEYIKKAKYLDLPAIAITNHGNMTDMFEFYSACKKENIKPIIGCEVYITDDRLDKKNQNYYHLVLIAKNKTGIDNLLYINNDAQINGFYCRARTDYSVLEKHSEGLICLSACIGGQLPKLILNNDIEEDKKNDEIDKFLMKNLNIFGSDFFLELQPGDFPKQIEVNKKLEELNKKYNIPLILTNDIHYLNKDDYIAHNIHVCASKGKTTTIDSDILYPDKCYYLMSNYEIKNASKFSMSETAFNIGLYNTNYVANIIEEYDLIPNKLYMPKFEVGENYNEDTYLEKLAFESLEKKMPYLKDPSEYITRLYYELNTIKKLGFSGYFLTVEDYVRYARTNDLETGPGRGSVCSSLVAYLLGITKVDPIKYDLLFERFLSEHRPSPPDIDLDFDAKERHRMFEYIINKYGKDHCSLVSTFTLRRSKSSLKDTGRVYGINKDIYEYVASLIPEVYYEDDEDGNSEKITDLSIEDSIKIVPELEGYYELYPEWFNAAIKLSNIPKATSVHAAGTIISPVVLDKIIPMVRSKEENLNATALNLKDAEMAGLIKFDFLSLCTLGVINHVKKLIGVKDIYEFIGEEFDDPKVWDLIGSKNISGLFQIGSSIYKQRMYRLKPRTIEELAACLALVRGPCIASKADEKYIRILEGKEEIELIHPIYDAITKETNGILIYQEQLMQICFEMGFTLDEGYKIMKLSAKKKIDDLKEYEYKFIEFSENKNMDRETAKRIFKMIVDTGLYSFNKAHGIAYAMLCYITAYLKLYYPKEFLIASLSNSYERKEPIKDLVADCRRLGYKFTSLDINKSKWEFTSDEDEYINIGFCAVKSFGYKAYQEVESKRPFNSLEDFLDKIIKANCTKRAIVPAILSGAFSCFDEDRINMYELYCELGDYKIEKELKIQGTKKTLKINNNYSNLEKAYLEEPLISDVSNSLNPIGLSSFKVNSNFDIEGVINKVKKYIDKNKNEMAFIEISTGDGILDCTVFANKYAEYKSYIRKNKVCNFNLKKQNDEKYIVNDIQQIS